MTIRAPVIAPRSRFAADVRAGLERPGQKELPSKYLYDMLGSALEQAERELQRLDSVTIVGLEREYLEGLREVAVNRASDQHLLVLFLGGTIGNFDRPAGDQ